jgi:hypothetical protein
MKHILTNWKTTLTGVAGIITGVVMIANGNVQGGIAAIIAGGGLILAKDGNQA